MIEVFMINKSVIFLILILGIGIVLMFYFYNPKSRINKAFSLLTFLAVFWIVFGYLANYVAQAQLALLFMKMRFATVSIFFVASYFFAVYFPSEWKRNLILDKIVLSLGIFFSVISLFTDLIIKGVQITEWGTEIIFGPASLSFFAMVIFLSLVIFALLLEKYLKVSRKYRIKIQYFLIGTFSFLLINLIFNVGFPLLGTYRYYYFGDYSVVFLLAFTVYAITKYELMGIKAFLTQILIMVISLILLLDIFLLSDNFTMQLLKVGVLITFLYFSRELVKSVRKEKEAVKELKRTYRKINHYTKRLEKGNKELEDANQRFKELLEMKNEFLHITSHQLRTPLTAIRGMISMWYEGDFEDLPEKDKRKMIKRILASADRLNNITNDMLDALELEGGFLKFQFKPVSIVKIIKETTNTLKPNFDKKNIYIKLETNLKVSDVEVEPNYIRQVFMNVIDNACKYTKKGGVSVSIKKENKYIKVIIKDTGIGISKVDQKKIFEKFTRGRNAISENASGSGLGLFIARKIVNEHGGKIKIESKGVGKGSTVKIYLKIKHGK
ncbi:MAG: hypothetical protein KAU07_01615 [Candidatus Andersenbacteria bacterium]|nr:hypothetical protein [Candidatus Andersenbacteria bacterium]